MENELIYNGSLERKPISHLETNQLIDNEKLISSIINTTNDIEVLEIMIIYKNKVKKELRLRKIKLLKNV